MFSEIKRARARKLNVAEEFESFDRAQVDEKAEEWRKAPGAVVRVSSWRCGSAAEPWRRMFVARRYVAR